MFLALFLIPPWLTTVILELMVNRRRPFEAEKKKPLVQMLVLTPSFPSGHATVSFACVSAMYFIDPSVFVWFLLAAIYVSLSRVAAGVHYFSDIIVGAFIGAVLPWGLLYVLLMFAH